MGRAALLLALSLALPARAGVDDLGEGDVDEDGPPPPSAAVVESYASEAVAAPGLERSLERMFALDYEAAETESGAFLTEHPDNPYAELFLAGQLWWRGATELLRAEDDPTLAERFDRHSRRAVAKAKRLFKSPKRRLQTEAYFVAGMSLGLRGQWRLTNRQYFKAYLDGKKAIKYLRKSVELDPEYHDAYLGLGIFDYQAAVLPGVLRLGALLLVRGDHDRGLARIRQAIDKGQFSNRQAASFLLSIYQTSEKDPHRALELVWKMRADFPKSPYYAGVEGMMQAAVGDTKSSQAAWADAYRMMSADPTFLRREAWAVLCGAYGDDCVSPERLAAAEAWASAALDQAGPEPAPGWRATLRLVRGLSRDARRLIKEARTDYDAALADPALPQTLRAVALTCRASSCSPSRLTALRRTSGSN